MRSSWIPRYTSIGNPQEVVFHTLGRAIYLDIAYSEDPNKDYYACIRNANTLLRSNFSDLFDQVVRIIAEITGDSVSLTENLALPGFHIFERSGLERISNNEPHYDLQHMRVKWPPGREGGAMLSFTLPIILPACGGGLEVWEDASKYGSLDAAYYPYDIGSIFIQEGMVLHRVAKRTGMESNERRITLQGHGVRVSGHWILYW